MRVMNKLWMGLICLALSACSGGSSPSGASLSGNESGGARASLSLRFERESDFDPDLSENTEATFRIAVSGDGIEPRVLTFDADTRSVTIDSLPQGAVVDILVEAINSDGYVVKRGYVENIAINQAVKEAVLDIVRVPIFLNVTERSRLSAKRLRLRILAEPGHRVSVSAVAADGTSLALRALGGATRFDMPDNGTFVFDPVNLVAGTYTLTLKDQTNGESTVRDVVIREGVDSVPIGFTAGGTFGSPRYQDGESSSSLIDVLYP